MFNVSILSRKNDILLAQTVSKSEIQTLLEFPFEFYQIMRVLKDHINNTLTNSKLNLSN